MMEVVVTNGAIARVKLQSNCHQQHTNIQLFYRPDALPVTQPTASKQGKLYNVVQKNKQITIKQLVKYYLHTANDIRLHT